MTIIPFNPNNIGPTKHPSSFNPSNVGPSKHPSSFNHTQYLSDYPEDSFEFVDYDMDEVEEPKKVKQSDSLEIKDKKERKKLLKQAWYIYYNSVDELNEADPKAYYQKGYSTKKDNHFEIYKYSKKGVFGSYKIKEVFVFKNNAPVAYSKYKLKYAYEGRDNEGWNFGLKENKIATCDFLR